MKLYLAKFFIGAGLFVGLSLACTVGHSDYYVAPTVGFISTPRSSGQSDTDTLWGVEGLYFKDVWLGGIKFDHLEAVKSGNSVINVESGANLLTVEGGYRPFSFNFSPYLFVGFGPYFQIVTTHVASDTSNDYSTTLVYKVGVGTVGLITDNFAAGLAFHIYPQAVMNSVDVVLSAGYYF